MDRRFSDMNEALKFISHEVLTRGDTVSPRGKETREIPCYSFTLTNPRARLITLPSRKWSESLALGEMCWHWAGSNDLGFISYYAKVWERFSSDGESVDGSCYGRRIFSVSTDGTSQWEMIKELLRRDPHSRRAVISLVPDDQGKSMLSLDMPCITSIQFLVRDGKLDCITTMRSNDVFWGLCYDVYLVTMLQERLSKELGVALGHYHHFAGSMHVYAESYEMAAGLPHDHAARSPIMPTMANTAVIPRFLEVESLLRTNMPGAQQAVHALPPYWRSLAWPLVKLHERRGFRRVNHSDARSAR